MKNAINWFSIPVSDLNRAKSFYETILDESLIEVDMDGGKMAFFPTQDQGVGGSLNLPQGEFQALDNDNVPIYLSTKNLDASLARVNAAGGQVLLGKTAISPDFGQFGIIADSEGNKVGLHTY